MERQTLFPPVILPLTTTTSIPSTAAATNSNIQLAMSSSSGTWNTDGWSIALLVLTSVRLILTIFLWTYLTYQTVRLKSSSHFGSVWPSQMLLATLFFSHPVLFLFSTQLTSFTCGIIRFSVGLLYALCFAILVLKLLLIVIANKGHDIPQYYLIILLVLMVGIQLALSIQWITLVPPTVVVTSTGNTCNTSILEWLWQLLYVILLILVGTGVAIATRDVKANHREAVFLGIAVGFNIPTWMIWLITALLMTSNPGVEEKCLAFGLFASTSIVMFVMFLPRSRQLSAVGDIGLYTEDTSVVKPISELTVHKLYYPVYHHHSHERIRSTEIISREENHDAITREDVGSIDTLEHEAARTNNAHHWYPPLRESGFRINPLHSTLSCRSMQQRHHHGYPTVCGSSSHFDTLAMNGSSGGNRQVQLRFCSSRSSGSRSLPSTKVARCLTPPSEEGSTTPSVHGSEVVSQDGSDVDIADFNERNVDGVSYTKVANRLPMY